MSDLGSEESVEELARLLCDADVELKVDLDSVPSMYTYMARVVITSDWMADALEAARLGGHVYEPGGHTRPFQKFPECKICGQLKH